MKSVLLSMFLFSLALVSCEYEEEGITATIENKNSTSFNERLATSDKIRTEDMIIFRTKLNEAVQIGQKGDKKQYQNTLIEASFEYLDLNRIDYDKTDDFSVNFSKALNLYSERLKELNSLEN